MKQGDFFQPAEVKGAAFSDDRKYRYCLWRIWDNSKPKVMFIGLNPSTANEHGDDPTIRRVISFAKAWGYGGVYMLNCFPYVSTDPKKLVANVSDEQERMNQDWLHRCSEWSEEVVFAWVSFTVIRLFGKVSDIITKFPDATVLSINKDGSPKHPLYVPKSVQRSRFRG